MNQTARAGKDARILVESAIMIALATVLSVFKLAELPYGGSITLASMLPIAVLAYRHGTLRGLGAGLVYGVIQQLLGLKNLSYFTTPQSIVAIILLDYAVAFAVIGLAGIFRRLVRRQSAAMLLGTLLAHCQVQELLVEFIRVYLAVILERTSRLGSGSIDQYNLAHLIARAVQDRYTTTERVTYEYRVVNM